MELYLKIPNNNPPFIGILFDQEYKAQLINTGFVNNYSDVIYQLVLDPSQKLYMTVTSNFKRGDQYAVDYDPVKLLKFMLKTKDCKLYNFGHLYYQDDQIKLARTAATGKKMLLQVDKITVITEY